MVVQYANSVPPHCGRRPHSFASWPLRSKFAQLVLPGLRGVRADLGPSRVARSPARARLAARRDEQCGYLILQHLGKPPNARRGNWPSCGHGLEEHVGKPFMQRRHEQHAALGDVIHCGAVKTRKWTRSPIPRVAVWVLSSPSFPVRSYYQPSPATG